MSSRIANVVSRPLYSGTSIVGSRFIVKSPSTLLPLSCRQLGTRASTVSNQSIDARKSRLNHNIKLREFHSSRACLASGGDVIKGDVVQFKLADIGEGIAECELIRWAVKEGDEIHQFDVLCEVQSDKASTEITSRYDGIVQKLHYKKGEMAKVGTPLVDIKLKSGSSAPQEAQKSETKSSQASEKTVSPVREGLESQNSQVLASPATRHLARTHNISLSDVPATGKGGRVSKEDVLAYIERKPGQASSEVPKPKATTAYPSTPTSVPPAAPVMQAPISSGSGTRVVPLSGYAKAMAKTMASTTAIPHFGYCDEINMDALQHLRKEFKAIAEKKGVKFSYMPFIVKAASLALKQYPVLNSSYDERANALIYKDFHNIGVAVDSPNGLIVPNVKNVQDKTLLEIAREINRIHELALKGSVSPADLSGGTFTISNIGSIGGTYASPVILPPEVAIGAIGKIQRLPRFDASNNVVAVNIMNVSWSADHRVIDGATMANFSNLWKKYLENPALMLMETK